MRIRKPNRIHDVTSPISAGMRQIANFGFAFLALVVIVTACGRFQADMNFPYEFDSGPDGNRSVSVRVAENGDIFFNGQKVNLAKLDSRYKSQSEQLEAIKIGADLFRNIPPETPEIPAEPERISVLNNKTKPPIPPIKPPEEPQIALQEKPVDIVAEMKPKSSSHSFVSQTGQKSSQDISRNSNAVNLPVIQRLDIPAPDVNASKVLDEYAAGIKTKILGNKSYPKISQRIGEIGTVSVEFTIDRSGAVTHTEISKQCAYDRLNIAAMDAVRKSSPFNPFPESLPQMSLTMSVDIVFEM